jgi:hypothetical protein
MHWLRSPRTVTTIRAATAACATVKAAAAEPLRVRLPTYPRQAEALSHASPLRRAALRIPGMGDRVGSQVPNPKTQIPNPKTQIPSFITNDGDTKATEQNFVTPCVLRAFVVCKHLLFEFRPWDFSFV